MTVAIEDCIDADMDRIFHIISEAFKHSQPYIDAVFPQHDTPAGHARGRDLLLEMKRTDPTARFIKAVDSLTGQIAGQAIWLILDKNPGEDGLEGDFWESQHEKEYAQELFAQFVVPRTEAFKAADGRLLGKSFGSDILCRGAQLTNSGIQCLTCSPLTQNIKALVPAPCLRSGGLNWLTEWERQ